ncbi:hypothetical protein DSECCO2_330530 [anaerobic digester metagenome]|nr:GIY-YIG nuclease family protein [Oscillibacter sp.]
MAILYFSDVLNKVGLNPAKVKLIRHALTDKGFKACYDANMVYEYTCHQDVGFSQGYEYWITFISDSGTLCKLHSCYKVGQSIPDTPDVMPNGVPEIEAKKFQGEHAYFKLEYVDLLKDYENRLVIDWGKSTRMWHQKGTTEKEIVSIQGDVFPGFESLCLPYDKLKKIINNQRGYEAWYTALSSVNAIYLIADQKTGTQYVGSAYNQDGLWGRWAAYIMTGGHGGNKKMVTALQENPERRHDLQFSVLQILPKNMSSDAIIQTESLWKEKLLTKKFGWNDN